MNGAHPDDFTLLVFLEGELSELEAARLRRHLAECPACAAACRDIDRLDRTLKKTAAELERALAEPELPPGDPFRCRPDCTRLGRPGPSDAGATSEALAASRAASEVKGRLLSAVGAPEEDLRAALSTLDLLLLRDRYGLGYALDEALYSMVDGPARWDRFGRLSREAMRSAASEGRSKDSPAESAYPLDDLLGLALLVEGAACNWTGDFARGGRSLRRAWGAFARGSTSVRRLASVELVESQRRAFLDRAREALHLSDRARVTFEALGIDVEAARARAAHAIALSYLGQEEDAIEEFRSILPVFASEGRWNAYASTLNGIGACLLRLSRPEQARREYARALRQVGREARPAVHSFIRANLARTLFEGKRYAEAARAFEAAARLYSTQGAKADELTMELFQLEALARAGAHSAARFLLDQFADRVRELGALDRRILDSLEIAVKGDLPDIDLLEAIRSQAEVQISDRLRRAS